MGGGGSRLSGRAARRSEGGQRRWWGEVRIVGGVGAVVGWAEKGRGLLGIRVVVAEAFERIHRSNLIGMGILPLEFPQGVTRKTLELT
ncbi:hypothetical protein, partial [Escherichia coli]|uniref:hypothetical protein n=1 Tax=Escherichia coli TaxID=562 RepID=UPI002585A96C